MLQKNIIKKYSKNHLDSDTIKEIYKKYTATFHNPEKIQHIKDSKEEQYQETAHMSEHERRLIAKMKLGTLLLWSILVRSERLQRT